MPTRAHQEQLDDAGFFYNRDTASWALPPGWQIADVGPLRGWADDDLYEAITREQYLATR